MLRVWFNHKLGLKIISLVLAIATWLYVYIEISKSSIPK